MYTCPKTGLTIALMAALTLGGCMRDQKSTVINTNNGHSEAEQLLNTTNAPMQIVEETGENDPLQAHMNARGQVDPSPKSNSGKYTSKLSAQDLNEPMHFRVLKLESQMAGLQEDFNRLLPPLKSIAASDDQLEQTLSQIKEHQQRTAAMNAARYDKTAAPPPGGVKVAPPPPPPPVKSAEELQPLTPMPPLQNVQIAGTTITTTTTTAPVPPPPPVAATPPAQVDIAPAPAPAPTAQMPSLAGSVTNVRLGQHPGGKIRVVLDVSGPMPFQMDLDNTEKLLLVELPGGAWNSAPQRSYPNMLVRGYSAQPSTAGSGTTLAIELSGEARVLTSTLPPSGASGYRIIFDIAPL